MKALLIKFFQKVFQKKARAFYAKHYKSNWLKNKNVYLKDRDYKKSPRFLFLPVPIINNKYWSNALKKKGLIADTLMTGHFKINNADDFDFYFETVKKQFVGTLRFRIAFLFGVHDDYLNYKLFDHIIRKYDILNMPFSGGILSFTPLKREEAQLIQALGAKIITSAYGFDYFQYSKVLDPTYRHAIMANYPDMARKEYTVFDNYKYWAEHSDIVMGSMATDGMGRWDILPVNSITIDTELWKQTNRKPKADGISEAVRISHSPNHRFVKGTEFILNAIEQLQKEGLKIKLVLIEKKTNEEVRNILENEIDIHVEQLVYTGYALSAIEGMASGLTVITNEENEILTKVLRRYSFLDECPAVSATPENITDVLRCLIKNPELREELGAAGRRYVEKYHSENMAQHMFMAIAGKIWFGKNIDLMSFFHPLHESSYNRLAPVIKHPLKNNKIPEHYFNSK
jgi:glycosyltransferase involved in cell wall biosynthesis